MSAPEAEIATVDGRVYLSGQQHTYCAGSHL
jgi:hypothetical protein